MIRKTETDTTIDDIHETRREISERFGGDIVAISADAEVRAQKSNWPVWTPPDRTELQNNKTDFDIAE